MMPRLKWSLIKAILRAVRDHEQSPLGRAEIRAQTGGTEEEITLHLERLQGFGCFNYSVMDEMHRETWANARYQYRLSAMGRDFIALLEEAE